MTTDPFVWMAAFLMLAYYSMIYAENPAFRAVEHLFVGISAANGIVMTYENFIRATFVMNIGELGEYHLFVPIVIGCLIYTRFVPSRDINWLARIPLAFWVGIGSALVIMREFRSNFIVQLTATFLNPFAATPATVRTDTLLTAIINSTMLNNIIIIIGVFCVMSYFVFTYEHRGAIGVSAKVGRYVMMIAFGAAYGNTVMARSAVLLGRVQFLLGNWLGIIETRV